MKEYEEEQIPSIRLLSFDKICGKLDIARLTIVNMSILFSFLYIE